MKNALASNTGLTSLDVSHNAIHDDGLRNLALGLRDNSTLRFVDMSANGLDVADEVPFGLKALCTTLLTHPSLEHLDLSHNQLGTVGAGALFESIQYSMTLSSINLVGVKLEPHMVARMVGIAIDSDVLQYLDLRDNSVCKCTKVFAEERLGNTSVLSAKTILLGEWDGIPHHPQFKTLALENAESEPKCSTWYGSSKYVDPDKPQTFEERFRRTPKPTAAEAEALEAEEEEEDKWYDISNGQMVPVSRRLRFHVGFPWEDFCNELY